MESREIHERTDLVELRSAIEKVREEIGKVIVGQADMIELLLAAMLADGHVLIEGVPGVAKTLTAKLLARCLDVPFSRIQFTPDLMPGDVLGTTVFDPQKASFQFKKGPIFSNIVLIDEINRSPAKTQAALFEVMEEKQVTFDGITYTMSSPFMVLATQNPVEHEGTYRLPEAQLDRFLFKIVIRYPNLEEEIMILQHTNEGKTAHFTEFVEKQLDAVQIKYIQEQVRKLYVEPKIMEYIARLIHETRSNKDIYLGGSPRASVAVLKTSKAIAAMHGRDFVTPDDVITVLPHVLRHRIMLTPEKEMEGVSADEVIAAILKKVEVPR
ncbi:MAG: MoxR family ATPase [Chitinophagaceae bacterium]